jgi:tryptophan halogenase
MHIKKVVIIGGGSSGWMTAAALSKCCPHLSITLVESKIIGTVGVGESTLGHINRFLRLLDLKDEDWMPKCNATYKNSIRFTNFRIGQGESFEYPFSEGLDYTDKPGGTDSWSELATLYPDEFPPESFAEFFCTGNTLLAKYNKQTKNKDKLLRNFDFDFDTAYHLDAQLFGQYLKDNVAIPNGVEHIIGDAHSFKKDHLNNITDILLIDGRTLTADLWIDCTGFKSLLLEDWMGSAFMPFTKYLANDSAWACRLPYTDRKKQMLNVTDCFALNNGWVWTIPLWNRIGTGYVYSKRFIEKENAAIEFSKHLEKIYGKKIADKAELFPISIRHGKRRRAWLNNVLGIGLSYGFVEPLESTGLLTTHENIVKLLDVLNRRNGYVTRAEKDAYNLAVDFDVTKFRDFVSQHYALSQRTDTPYWRWCTQINEYVPEQFNEFVLNQNQYTNFLGSMINHHYHSDYIGNMYIAAGMGLKSIATKNLIFNFNDTKNLATKKEQIGFTKRAYFKYREAITKHVLTLPSHYDFLKDNIYNGIDEYINK